MYGTIVPGGEQPFDTEVASSPARRSIATIDDYTLHDGPEDQLSRWRLRSWRFRVRHRCNVVALALRAEVRWRSALMALRYPECYTALASKTPGKGVIFVCPAVLAHLDHIDGQPVTSDFAASCIVDQRS